MKEIDWSNLSFGYMKTDYNVRINFREGEWGKLEISSSELINLHMAATCLHYGQEAAMCRLISSLLLISSFPTHLRGN